jgi:hypothetical protein
MKTKKARTAQKAPKHAKTRSKVARAHIAEGTRLFARPTHLDELGLGWASRKSSAGEHPSLCFEAILVDPQPDLRLHGRSWHAKHSSRAGRSEYLSSTFAQGSLNHLLFLGGKL